MTGVPHRRRSIRLTGYDYAQRGAYFVTVVTQHRACSFGEVREGAMYLTDAGRMVQSVWEELPQFYAGVLVDAFVVMPNHVHGIVMLVGKGPGQPRGAAPTMSLPDIVHRFKSLTTARYRHAVESAGWPPFAGRMWQRNYYEHIIRDEDELNRIRDYIVGNPATWAEDEYHA